MMDPAPAACPRNGAPRRTEDVLLEHGIITTGQLDLARRHRTERTPSARLEESLVELGFASWEQILQAVASHLGRPYLRLEPEMVRADALRVLPVAFLEAHNLLPLAVAEGWLTVALERFNDPFLLSEIARRTGMQVQPVAAEPERIRAARRAAITSQSPSTSAASSEAHRSLEAIIGDVEVDELQVVEDAPEDDSTLEASAAESPIVKLVSYIIRRGLDLGASDIHIEPDEAHVHVRYRVDGELVAGERPPRALLPAVVSRIKILSGMDISERRLPQDGGLTVGVQDRAVDLRVSTMNTRQGEKVVMRIVDRHARIRSLDELGLEGEGLRDIRMLLKEPHGLMLVTGPTGSGKSTTLYSALSEIASDEYNTSTIEDPVERRLRGVNQFQVHEKSGFTFARALRSLLRQDPDIIMVGEIRDLETARLATEAALTGHLVLSTLHTNDAPSAVPRLIGMGVERFMVAAALRGVLAQRLVRRLCPSCRKVVSITPAQRLLLNAACGDSGVLRSAHACTGCTRCAHRGIVGRIGVFDALVLNESVLAEALAGEGSPTVGLIRSGRAIPGLLADGLSKVSRGLISLDSLLELISHTQTSRVPATPDACDTGEHS